MTFDQKRALDDYTELMRRVHVGAYEERSSYHYESGTWPEDGIEESIFNLDELAARNGLEFCWHKESRSYTLEPMSDETRQARARAQAYQDELDRAHQSAENTRLAHLPSVREEDEA